MVLIINDSNSLGNLHAAVKCGLNRSPNWRQVRLRQDPLQHVLDGLGSVQLAVRQDHAVA